MYSTSATRADKRLDAILERGSTHHLLGIELLEPRQVLSVAMVADIFPGGQPSFASGFFTLGEYLYFIANDGTVGHELWRTDGTTVGTVRVVDILPGYQSSDAADAIAVGPSAFLKANDGTTGRELWKTDGTASGTKLVKDIWPGLGQSVPSLFANVNGIVYFAATDSISGRELWKSDGTTAGTTRVADIRIGSGGSEPFWLTNVNGRLFFLANDGVSGQELWASDGSVAGTNRVFDIRQGAYGAFQYNTLTNVNGTLFFAANDGINGDELWATDGTSAGTVLIADIRPGAGGSSPNSLANIGGTVYFTANDGTSGYELWKSDGTTSGTVRIADVWPGPEPSRATYFRYVENVGGTICFLADDGSSGNELWKTDGTSNGTQLVADIWPGTNGSRPRYFFTTNNTLYFIADDEQLGLELWKSDGTSSGTALVADINYGPGSSVPISFTVFNGSLYFGANDGTHGHELWRSIPDTQPPTLNAVPVTISTSASSHGSYIVPTGSGEQFRTIPLAAINRVQLQFTEDVRIDANDLVLRGDSHGPVPYFSFDFNPQTNVATWQLDVVLPADRWTMTLNADGVDPVTDLFDNVLDGEWDNPTDLFDPTSGTSAGDGTPGGDFVFQFTVLPGDANRDNRVTGADYTEWADGFDNGQGPADALFTEGDFNGDGHVTGADYTLWANHFGSDFTAAPLAVAGETAAGPPRVVRRTLGATRVDSDQRLAEPTIAPLAKRTNSELRSSLPFVGEAEVDHRPLIAADRGRAARQRAIEEIAESAEELLVEIALSRHSMIQGL